MTWKYNQEITPDAKYAGNDFVRHYNFLKSLILEHPPNIIILTLNRLYNQQWKPKLMKEMIEFLIHQYPDIQLLTGEKEYNEDNKLSSLGSNLKEIQLATNHPVHILEKEHSLSASALIPFCWVGKDTNIGVKIDQFSIPVCRGFEKKIRNDQLCYEFHPGDLIMNGDVRNGLHLIVDDNKDRMRFGSLNSLVDKEENKKLHYNKDDETEGVKVYLDAIG